jgi:hypothetical protein
MGRVKSIGFHQHVMRRQQKVTMMGIAGELKRRGVCAINSARATISPY